MKKLSISVFLSLTVLLAMNFVACKSKNKDAEIKTTVENALRADPMSASATVTVDKGVVTINGVCNDEASKARTGDLVKDVKGVKSVVNNCTVVPPPAEPVVNADDDALNRGLVDALKDNSGVSYSINQGKIVLTGNISKAKWRSLKENLDKLKSKGYDLTGLKIN